MSFYAKQKVFTENNNLLIQLKKGATLFYARANNNKYNQITSNILGWDINYPKKSPSSNPHVNHQKFWFVKPH
jgi:hypothetical protein